MKPTLLLLIVALVASVSVCEAQPKATSSSSGGVGQAFKDAWITSKTKMALMKDPRTKARHITVETNGAVVALRGKVDSAEARSVADDIARGIDGVKRVHNALEMVPPKQRDAVDARDTELTRAAEQRLESDARLQAADIDVRSDNGTVTLTGTVPDAPSRARAGDLVRKIRGVRSVRNELRL